MALIIIISSNYICDIKILHSPEKISLGNGASVFAIQTEERNAGKLPVFHFLQCLSQSFIFKYVCYIAFWC